MALLQCTTLEGSAVKKLPANAGDAGVIPGWEYPLEKQQLALSIPAGKFHGQRS